jgi:hypothetical protein
VKPFFHDRGITIFHGESRELLPKICSEYSADLDPPYKFSMGGNGGFHSPGNAAYNGGRTYLHELEAADCISFDPMDLLGVKTAPAIVACANKELVDQYIGWARRMDWLFDIHVLIKTNPIPAKSNHYLHDIEYLAVLREKRSYFSVDAPFWCYHKYFLTYNDGDKLHPAQKPLPLMTKYVLTLCPVDGLVVDPYMGSGTTLLAARAAGRRAIGIEREEKYCEVAAERLGQEVLFA